jgi:hypothetical protein
MSGIQTAMTMMGYAAGVGGPDTCRNCAHGNSRANGLRCTKGSFYVVASGSCNKFVQRTAVNDEAKVHIGPSDIT